MKKTLFAVVALLFIGAGTMLAQRSVTTINEAWQFQKADGSDKAIVDIPHCWNAQDITDDARGYYRGKGIYSKNITLSDIEGNSFYLHFEGANQTAELKVNGKVVGSHIGGYTQFTFDITPYIQEGTNALEVTVDNSHNEDIPPLSADFTFMGGIYRDIELIKTGKVHLSNTHYATNGVYITTPEVSKDKAVLMITSHITNGLTGKNRYILSHEIIDPSGKTMKTVKEPVKVSGMEDDLVCTSTLVLEQPVLWSTTSPNLYHVVTTLADKKGNVLDKVMNRAGMRWFRFDPEKGFFLNGEPVKLIGTSRHQDYRDRGNALDDAIHVEDVLTLKELGGNFLRISHYPQDPVITQMCDKLGIVTSVEIPIVNGVTETDAFQQNSLSMLREMIWQDYNSPSVCIWAYMNEVLLRPKYNKRNNAEAYTKYLNTVYNDCFEINAECKRLDPYRATMLPCHSAPDLYEEAGVTKIPDILGWNYYLGWYGGTIEDFKAIPEYLHKKFPDKNHIITEYGADMNIRLHSFEPERFDYTPEYGLKYHKVYLPTIMNNDLMTGGLVWNLNDFLSEARAEAEPHVNNKGMSSLDREHKDVFYYYQAMLSKDPKVIIGAKSWKHRGGMTDEKGFCEQPVSVFSNMANVELTVNGQSLGTKRVENGSAEFMVPFKDGENYLTAAGQDGAKKAVDYEVVHFKGYPKQITADFDELNVYCTSKMYFDDRINGIAWIPEKAYTEGSWGYVGGEPARPRARGSNSPRMTFNALGTENDPLYQCQRKNLEAFKADVPDGQYYVYLHFAEWNSNDRREALAYSLGGGVVNEQAKERIFDVAINGEKVLVGYDLSKEAGAHRAVVKKFSVSVTGGEGLNVQFIPVKGETILNAIRIYKAY